ncbi:uncharacterized protein LOC129321039 [Prosopis cineraria]|uniref:uncharacterized protein LOC129321039 n=1 Tax=Prosopis cineraria TaxID=364024 RepID=UPI00240F3E2D|nr:uncharacterized protein LOC129321039 [Prosopis cineraria]
MDLWFVAAAAGAGYLFWNRNLKNSDSSCQSSSEDPNFENLESPSQSSHRELQRDKLNKDVSSEQKVSKEKPREGNSVHGMSTMEITSNKMLLSERTRPFGMHDDSIALSISNLPLSLSPNENLNDIEDGNEQIYDVGGSYGFRFPDSSAGEVGSNHHSAGNKTCLKTKHFYGHFGRPLNSLESCLMAQLCKEHSEMEEYVLSSLPPPPTPTRSFLVSNGSRIISGSSHKSFSTLIGKKEHKWIKGAHQDHDGSILGFPSLTKFGSLDDHKKLKHRAGKLRSERLSSSDSAFSRKNIHAQLDVTFLFSLGLSFGIVISIMTNKREADKLRDLLKQTENLVQDLQEELEMKDSMTVKELSNENYGSQDICDHSSYNREPNGFSSEKHVDNSLRDDCRGLYHKKEEENSEPMSKIEAELEAELERLGLNMNSSLERRLSELVEVDPDFVADFAGGELRTDKVQGKAFPPPNPEESTSDGVTPLPGNYAVSPHELSLRLHQVIESRLEEHVKELEIALQNSQRKLQLMESEHKRCYLRNFSSHGEGNPLTYDDCDPLAQPLVMNLSGEALDAYKEAYEELIKTDESEENSPSTTHDDEGVFGIQWGGTNRSVTFFPGNGERFLELSSSGVNMLEGQSPDVYELKAVTRDENYGSDNEMERQVIRQIVDRTKRGSPAFKNVQKLLYSMDGDER